MHLITLNFGIIEGSNVLYIEGIFWELFLEDVTA